jgi:hypothetical protein
MLPSFFNRFNPREKILLVGLVVLVLGIWGITWMKRLGRWKTQWNYTSVQLGEQKLWLDEAPQIEADLYAARGLIQQDQVLDASKLVARVDKLARLAGLNYEISSPKTQDNNLFQVHSVSLNIRQADLKKLINLDASLKADFPYVAISKVRLTPVPSNPTLLDAVFVIHAFELFSI